MGAIWGHHAYICKYNNLEYSPTFVLLSNQQQSNINTLGDPRILSLVQKPDLIDEFKLEFLFIKARNVSKTAIYKQLVLEFLKIFNFKMKALH